MWEPRRNAVWHYRPIGPHITFPLSKPESGMMVVVGQVAASVRPELLLKIEDALDGVQPITEEATNSQTLWRSKGSWVVEHRREVGLDLVAEYSRELRKADGGASNRKATPACQSVEYGYASVRLAESCMDTD